VENMDKDDLKEVDKEQGKVHPKFFEKTVQDNFGSDPYKLIIELIKNAADSYMRLGATISPPFEIFVEIDTRFKGFMPYIEVRDNAEGMSSDDLERALEYGAPPSAKTENANTSSEKGVGLKDVLMSLGDNRIITVKNDKVTIASKDKNFDTIFLGYKAGEREWIISKNEREKYKLKGNGTIVSGFLPKFFLDKKFETIKSKLEKHYLLRKLLQCEDFKIYIIDRKSNQSRPILLKYSEPKISKVLVDDSFEIEYEGKTYSAQIKINEAKESLGPLSKPFGSAGLLVYSGKYTVLDLILGNYKNDSRLYKIFGEVHLDLDGLEQKIRNGEEKPLVDTARHGLIPENMFNKNLFEAIDKYLKEILEINVEPEYGLDSVEEKEFVRKVNKIYGKDVSGNVGGGGTYIPIRPENFELYPQYVFLPESEDKVIYLVINSKILSKLHSINILSKDPDLQLSTSKIDLEDEKSNTDGFIVKQIKIHSDKIGLETEIVANTNEINHESISGVIVVENPLYNPENGFSFVPNKTSIVKGGSKKVSLSLIKNLINSEINEIKLETEGPISCPGKIIIPTANLNKKLIKNVLIEEIDVKAEGEVGAEAYIIATYGNKTSTIKIKIIEEPSIGGFMKHIELSPDERAKEIAHFDETGTLTIYYKHPLFKMYMANKNFKSRPDFITFLAETITREIIKAAIIRGMQNNSPSFPQTTPGYITFEDVDAYFTREYYEKGPELHELSKHLIKKLKFL
jgi:hypothetical protein